MTTAASVPATRIALAHFRFAGSRFPTLYSLHSTLDEAYAAAAAAPRTIDLRVCQIESPHDFLRRDVAIELGEDEVMLLGDDDNAWVATMIDSL